MSGGQHQAHVPMVRGGRLPCHAEEALGRSEKNPAKGWYGLKKGLRGRFGVYLPPLLEALGLVELEHNAGNRVRAH